jgi:hypothetical protein
MLRDEEIMETEGRIVIFSFVYELNNAISLISPQFPLFIWWCIHACMYIYWMFVNIYPS